VASSGVVVGWVALMVVAVPAAVDRVVVVMATAG